MAQRKKKSDEVPMTNNAIQEISQASEDDCLDIPDSSAIISEFISDYKELDKRFECVMSKIQKRKKKG